jgi:hypothetical protein
MRRYIFMEKNIWLFFVVVFNSKCKSRFFWIFFQFTAKKKESNIDMEFWAFC